MSNVIKIVLIITLFFSLGVLVLPSTLSLFAGQHFFYNLESGYGSKCIKCHADIFDELSAGAYHNGIGGVSSGEECLVCHRVNTSIVYANASTNTPGREAHAASTIECSYCHFNSSNPFGAPVAGGFGLSTLANDTGTNASHLSFVLESIEASLLQNESEACVACHTTMGVIIHFNVSVEARMVANNTYSASQSYWNIEDITPSNFTTYTEVKE
jgi:hypothetical protein